MAKACLETAAANPEKLDSIGLYFELWILKLGGYLPDWSRCENCRREIGGNAPAGLQINFHILCHQCNSNRNKWLISPEQRKLFYEAQKVSPTKFIDLAKSERNDVKEISAILRRLISNILGRETVEEKILTANL
jgi:recombinational DNA repair protein (RecF pathway)